MAKRIAVFTLQGLVNYGNRLQNYAVEYLLKKRNFEVDSIVLTKYPLLKPRLAKFMRQYKKSFGNRYEKIEAKRQELFNQFNKKINIRYYNIKDLDVINEEYDVCLAGSDQVWNPAFNTNYLFLLPFAQKRACLSPSFGVDKLLKHDMELYSKELMRFDCLSAREESGAKLIYNLIGRKVDVLIDPTMALDIGVWEDLEEKPQNFYLEDFIFSYTLGELGRNRENAIQLIREKHQYEHVEVFDDLKENKYIVGPGEFLWLIHNAKIIVTDSFHAAVFSILFEKPFIVIRREGAPAMMFDRIQTLLNKFHLEKCNFEYIDAENFMNVDYSYCKTCLIEERKKINEYLDKALKV